MKHVIVIGNLYRWQEETRFISEMLHMAAAIVITINIGRQGVAADLNARELRQIFPGKPLEESLHLSISRLYSQGIADGILALLGKEPHLYSLIDRAVAALPFGKPKIAVLTGDCTWSGPHEVMEVNLPGIAFTLNPVIKTLLGNTAFAISGMSLCNTRNFRSTTPTIGIAGIDANISKYLDDLSLDYIMFPEVEQLLPLLNDGYIGGILMANHAMNARPHLEVAAGKAVPVVIISQNPDATKLMLASPTPMPGTVVCSHHQELPCQWSAPQRCHSIPYRYGSEDFYRYAIQTLIGQLQ